MKRIWKYNILSDDEMGEFYKASITAQTLAESEYKRGFQDGVVHLFQHIQGAINTNNPNRLFATSHLLRDQMVFLFTAITGGFIKRKEQTKG